MKSLCVNWKQILIEHVTSTFYEEWNLFPLRNVKPHYNSGRDSGTLNRVFLPVRSALMKSLMIRIRFKMAVLFSNGQCAFIEPLMTFVGKCCFSVSC